MTPKLIFIVPYRDRIQHKYIFTNYMKHILEDYEPEDYEIYFSHQCDTRSFNRGAVKNIGFLAMKEKYPNDYKQITFVFNDVDTMPYKKGLLSYETIKGTVKHFYGFRHALGGLFSIKGSDFEMINGFPNLWGWGHEDNIIYDRALKAGLKVDRSNFFPIGNQSFIQFFEGFIRSYNVKETIRAALDKNYPHGLNAIHDLKTNVTDEYINITHFSCEDKDQVDVHWDIRTKKKIPMGVRRRCKHQMRMEMK